MNKDVIYIEPEDDITDIITKIENSKEKIIALVPPKKAGVFRSVVNIKLISKSGASNEKSIVLVTTDPSIIRLAASVRMPVTKDLQSAPMVPTVDTLVDEDSKAELVEVTDNNGESEVETTETENEESDDNKESEETDGEEATKDADDDDKNEEDDENAPSDKKTKKAKLKNKAKKQPGENWFKSHKKRLIFGGIGIVALIGVLVWAFVFAPAVDITVWIQTENKPFSEGVSFVNSLGEEDAKEGKFYLEEKKIDTVQEVKFEATGKKNLGEKATGVLTVSAAFDYKNGGAMTINAGDLFSYNGLTYAADNTVPLRYDGDDDSVCANSSASYKSFKEDGCIIYASVKVTATAPGSEYNIGPSEGGWSTILNLKGISLKEAMTGGTDNVVTVVQQSDVIKAKEELNSGNEAENKKRLYEGIGDEYIILEQTFAQTTSDATATPAAGEEVGEGTTPTLKATTVTSVKVIDKTKVKEFITNKADISEQQKVYEMEDPFIDNFTQTGNGYIGKLKTNYSIGPKVTNSDVLEMALGKGIGDLQHDLKQMPGIVSVETKTSYPWVMVVPNDTNKVSIDIKVKEKDNKQGSSENTEDAKNDNGTNQTEGEEAKE